MPDALKKALLGMSDEERDEVWDWLDGTSDASLQMIELLAKSLGESG